MSEIDLIVFNARIVTVDDSWRVASAMAIRDGKITKIGGAELLNLANRDTEIRDCHGSTILPGFVEAHGHPTVEMNLLAPGTVDLRATTCGTAEEVLRRLDEAISNATIDDWITAYGWDPLLLPDLPLISGAWLSEICPDKPLSVMHYSAHTSWANREAIERLGLNAETQDPAGSHYERRADGTLSGAAVELPASVILMGPRLEPCGASFAENLGHTLNRMNRAGVTTTGDLAVNPASHKPLIDYFATNDPSMRIRTYEMSRPEGPSEFITEGAKERNVPREKLRNVGVKVWSDGTPWLGNIGTSFPYLDSDATRRVGVQAGHRGCGNYSVQQLLEIGRAYLSQGMQLACHVHGDESVSQVLDVIEKLRAEHPNGVGRFRLEHCGSITPAQVDRAHKLGATASFFVAHIHYYGDVLFELFGERASAWTPAGAAEAIGMPFSLHNDAPVTPELPLLSIQVAVTRATQSGKILGPEYAVSVREAIRAHTRHAAWQLHSETEVGSLEVGKFADFVILSDDPELVSVDSIGEIQVLETWFAGKKCA